MKEARISVKEPTLTLRPFSRTIFPHVAVPHYVLWFCPPRPTLVY